MTTIEELVAFLEEEGNDLELVGFEFSGAVSDARRAKGRRVLQPGELRHLRERLRQLGSAGVADGVGMKAARDATRARATAHPRGRATRARADGPTRVLTSAPALSTVYP